MCNYCSCGKPDLYLTHSLSETAFLYIILRVAVCQTLDAVLWHVVLHQFTPDINIVITRKALNSAPVIQVQYGVLIICSSHWRAWWIVHVARTGDIKIAYSCNVTNWWEINFADLAKMLCSVCVFVCLRLLIWTWPFVFVTKKSHSMRISVVCVFGWRVANEVLSLFCHWIQLFSWRECKKCDFWRLVMKAMAVDTSETVARNVGPYRYDKWTFRFDEGKVVYRNLIFSFFPNATTCPLWTSWSPSRLWPKCNLLLRLGRPWGVVTLSPWGGWWYMNMKYQEGP
jgi:hypothetical protein